MDIDYDHHKSNSSAHLDSLMRSQELIIDKIEMLEKLLTKVEFSRLNNHLQAIILYDIIQDWFSLNYLRKFVVEEGPNHVILNKEN